MHKMKYLHTFDEPATVAAPVVAAVAPAVPAAGEPAVSISALNSILQAADERARAAREESTRIATTVAPVPVAAAPAAPPAEDAVAAKLSLKTVDDRIAGLERMLTEQRLENERLRLINDARTKGGLIEALVFGNNSQELAASVAVARAEYEAIAAEVTTNLTKQLETKLAEGGLRLVSAETGAPVATPAVSHVIDYKGGAVTSLGAQPIGLPGFVTAAPATLNADPNILSAAQIEYLTSATGIRSGEYAANRHKIHYTLRSMGQQGAQAAPPASLHVPTFAAAPPVSAAPQTFAAGPMQSQAAMARAPWVGTQNAQSFNVGAPPQPVNLQPGAPFDAGAALAAGQAAIAAMRVGAASMQPTH